MFYTIMSVVLNILNVVVLIKGCSFALYEIKNNSNKFGGIITIITGIIVFSLILYILWWR